MEENKLLLAELYVAFFDRAPDSAGLEYWLNEIDSGLITLEQMSINWANEQQEFVDNYGTDISYETFIPQVYTNILGREPDTEGLNYWMNDLTAGNVSTSNFITAMINGAKATTGSLDDAIFLNNRAEVGISVADSGISDIEFAKSAVAAVTKDPTTVDIVKSIVTVSKESTDGLASATVTLNTINELILTIVDYAVLTQVITNVKTLVEGVQTSVQIDTTLDIKSTLETISTVVKAAKTDATFLSNPENLAIKVVEDANTLQIEASANIPLSELSDIFGSQIPTDLSDVALPEGETTDTPTEETVTPPSYGGGDGTPPTVTVSPNIASATTISLTANESSTAGIYTSTPTLIGSTVSLSANVSNTITVAAQSSITSGSIKVTDGSGNSTTSTEVILGTIGKDTLNGNTNKNIIFGFDDVDTITAGGEADIIAGGTGADVFVISAGDSLVALSDTIADMNTGGLDKIDHSVILSLGGSTADATSGNAKIDANGLATFHVDDNTLALKIAAVAADLEGANNNTAGKVALFEDSGNSYVFITDNDGSTTTGDDLIVLSGVTNLDTVRLDSNGDITLGAVQFAVAGASTLTGTSTNSNIFVAVGITAAGQYTGSDSNFADLTTINSQTTSQIDSGDVFSGGDGYDVLHVYGTSDLSSVTLTSIDEVILHSDVTLSAAQLNTLNTNKALITGDGGSTLRTEDAGSTTAIDLSAITFSDLGQIEIGNNITATMSQTNLDAIKTVSSSFTNTKIQAAATALDFSSKNIFGDATILDNTGTTTGETLKTTTSDFNVGSIIDTVNTVISTINTALSGGSYSSYQQTAVTESEYALLCDDLAGGSVLQGQNGMQNFISGGTGSDTIYGGSSTNFIYAGAETTTDGTQTNTITGGAARDFIMGSKDQDTISGAEGNDFIDGDTGVDTIQGGAGTDFIRSGDGNDIIKFEANATANGVDFIDASGVSGDIFNFAAANTASVFSGQTTSGAGSFFQNTTANLGSLGTEAFVVLTDATLGDASSLQTALNATALDTTNIGSKIFMWDIDNVAVGVAMVSNTDTIDNDNLTVELMGIIGAFSSGTNGFLSGLTDASFTI